MAVEPALLHVAWRRQNTGGAGTGSKMLEMSRTPKTGNGKGQGMLVAPESPNSNSSKNSANSAPNRQAGGGQKKNLIRRMYRKVFQKGDAPSNAQNSVEDHRRQQPDDNTKIKKS